jgi:hypothetical protein
MAVAKAEADAAAFGGRINVAITDTSAVAIAGVGAIASSESFALASN